MPKAPQTLRYAGLAKKTVAAYRRALSAFFSYLEDEEIEMPSKFHHLDRLIAQYLESLYLDDTPISYAGHLLSAFRRFVPQSRSKIPIAKQWFSNWTSEHVPRQAIPMPANVVLALAGATLEVREHALAALLLLGYKALLRTSEMTSLRFDHVSWKPGEPNVVIAIPFSKTSPKRPQSILIRDPWLPFLLSFAWERSESAFMWDGSTPAFRQALRLLLDTLNLASVGFTAYSIRRGGASHAFAQGVSFDSLVELGRWNSVKTARLYLDSGRAALIQMHFPPHVNMQLATFVAKATVFCKQLRQGRRLKMVL